MVYGCGAKTVKCLVFFFNFLAFLAGGIIFVVSLVAYFNKDVDKYLETLMSKEGVNVAGLSSFHTVLILSAVVGGVIFLAGFAGCCGALTESACLLSVFSIIMIILIVAQLAMGIAVFAFKPQVHTGLDKAINETYNKAMGGDADACAFFNDTAKDGVCCGADGSITTLKLHCTHLQDCKKSGNGTGCADQLWSILWKNMKWAGLALLIMLVLELAATIFACCLCSAVRKGQNLYEYV